MKITRTQKKRLSSLTCERLFFREEHLRQVGTFYNDKYNSGVANVLQNDAFEEDENGKIAYYLIKNSDGDILFFFSLKCGLLYDEFIEGDRLQKIHNYYELLRKTRNLPDTKDEEKKLIDYLLEQARVKKGIQKAEVASVVQSAESKAMEDFFSNGKKNVGQTFAGIELVHFCANDNPQCRTKWCEYGLDPKLGTVVFWQFIVPIVQKAMMYIGCEYLYLFAADTSEDERLVNYYRTYLNFQVKDEHGAAIPLYDFSCKFMYQPTSGLSDARKRFFASFNNDENAV